MISEDDLKQKQAAHQGNNVNEIQTLFPNPKSEGIISIFLEQQIHRWQLEHINPRFLAAKSSFLAKKTNRTYLQVAEYAKS